MKKILTATDNVTVYTDCTLVKAKGATLEFTLLNNGETPDSGMVVVTDLDKTQHEIGTWERERTEGRRWSYRFTPFEGKRGKWHFKAEFISNLGYHWMQKRYNSGCVWVDKHGVYHGVVYLTK